MHAATHVSQDDHDALERLCKYGLHIPHCELLRQVWKIVPLVWVAGLPTLRPPPTRHRCRR